MSPLGSAHWNVESLRTWFESDCERQYADPQLRLREGFGITDPDGYWDTVKTNLAAERIRLVFVADEIPPALRIILEFLNRQMSETEVFAIEALLDEIAREHGEGAAQVARLVIGWAKAREDVRIDYGRGAQSGSAQITRGRLGEHSRRGRAPTAKHQPQRSLDEQARQGFFVAMEWALDEARHRVVIGVGVPRRVVAHMLYGKLQGELHVADRISVGSPRRRAW